MREPGGVLTVLLGVALGGALVVGCGGGGGGGGMAAAPVSAAPAPPGTPPPQAFGSSRWPHPTATRLVEEGRFATSPLCASCHSASPQATALRDGADRPVGPYDLWQASMMANAARDPLWRAAVSVELQATPAARAAIERKCMSCHSPMANHDAKASGQTINLNLLSQDTPRAQLALDGVSCTYCHQIVPDLQDVASSFNGNEALTPNKDLLGPYDNPVGTPMALRTGYLPRKADHVRESAMCASCHTLYTTTLDDAGRPTGSVHPEQTAFLEWQNSIFDDTRTSPGARATTCQGCHMPTTDEDGQAIATKIARENGGRDFPNLPVRSPFGRHVFVGGNTLVPAILRDRRADLSPQAPDAAFDQLIAATREQLQQRTARVSLGAPTRAGDALRLPVRVDNLTGHKLPTGHPTRRMWMRLVVRDAAGQVVFASGEHDAAGRLVDRAGRPLAGEAALGPTYPHRDRITAEDEVQVWEAVMRDDAGAPTFLLLRGAGYWKDDRLLPQGWDPAHPAATDTIPAGVTADTSFGAGSDTVIYEVAAPAGRGPFQVEATLFYQALGARFADELFRHSTPEVEAFRAYYEAADRTPEALGQATLTAP